MNKTISINPELFSLSTSKRSTKKKQRESKDDIKIKPQKDKTKRMRKQHILRFLRQKQEENYKKLMQTEKPTREKTIDHSFNNDFDESLKFLKDITETTNDKHNFTSKSRHLENKPLVSSSLTPIEINTDSIDDNRLTLSKPVISNASAPVWGCLKNGSLPTFRDWKNSTQKNYLGTTPNKNEISAMMKAQKTIQEPKLKYIRQKKTVKRRYKVGKSNNVSKVAVLISNKTIRNNIMNKTQEIKMKSVDEMKRYLIKRGFIRVGTSAPNDVIRKMYETANLVCGEIENHNADNLLFNYMNDIE
jgi:hypothetical protein